MYQVSGDLIIDVNLAVLCEINTALWAIVYIVGVVGILMVATVVLIVFLVWREAVKSSFHKKASALTDRGEFKKLLELCHREIKKKPNNEHAYWFLGRAYYAIKEYSEAEIGFNKALELRPEWEEKHIGPYLKKIEERCNIH